MTTIKERVLKQERRLKRQIAALTDNLPWARDRVERLLDDRMRLVRVPVGVAFVFGGFVGFLPVLGFWMLPLGLLLLAIDLPALRPAVSSASIRLRRRLRSWRRRRDS
jgi:hypothetical protein